MSSSHLLFIPKFRFLRQTSYSCGGREHQILEYTHKKTGLEFVLIPGGTFYMGSRPSRSLAREAETPRHQVYLNSFLMAKYPVTQKIWKKVMEKNPSFFQDDQRPVDSINWREARQFCRKTGLVLPSESQWEYACRAGTTTQFYWGEDMNGDYCWYLENSENCTHPVGEKKPNAYGLFDMSGNVWEWCEDVWYETYERAPKDGWPREKPCQFMRVFRGGSFNYPAPHCRSAHRDRDDMERRWRILSFRPIFPLFPRTRYARN